MNRWFEENNHIIKEDLDRLECELEECELEEWNKKQTLKEENRSFRPMSKKSQNNKRIETSKGTKNGVNSLKVM